VPGLVLVFLSIGNPCILLVLLKFAFTSLSTGKKVWMDAQLFKIKTIFDFFFEPQVYRALIKGIALNYFSYISDYVSFAY